MKSFHRALSFAISHILGDEPVKAIKTWRQMHEEAQITWAEFVYLATNCAHIVCDRRVDAEMGTESVYGKLNAEFIAIGDRLGMDYEPAKDARWDQVNAQLDEIYNQWAKEILRSAGAEDLVALQHDPVAFDALKKEGDQSLLYSVSLGQMIAPQDCLASRSPSIWKLTIHQF